jgi:hypothetical protein
MTALFKVPKADTVQRKKKPKATYIRKPKQNDKD